MLGPNGKHAIKLTKDEFAKWQGWDEWPERIDDPPLTMETSFWYQYNEYMITSLRNEYMIVTQPDFREVIRNKNFKALLEMPFIDGKSFYALIGDFLFED